jgi:hypothetical protein
VAWPSSDEELNKRYNEEPGDLRKMNGGIYAGLTIQLDEQDNDALYVT